LHRFGNDRNWPVISRDNAGNASHEDVKHADVMKSDVPEKDRSSIQERQNDDHCSCRDLSSVERHYVEDNDANCHYILDENDVEQNNLYRNQNQHREVAHQDHMDEKSVYYEENNRDWDKEHGNLEAKRGNYEKGGQYQHSRDQVNHLEETRDLNIC
jgi:hypothetical protein